MASSRFQGSIVVTRPQFWLCSQRPRVWCAAQSLVERSRAEYCVGTTLAWAKVSSFEPVRVGARLGTRQRTLAFGKYRDRLTIRSGLAGCLAMAGLPGGWWYSWSLDQATVAAVIGALVAVGTESSLIPIASRQAS